jgi:hypothetical protein
MMLTNQVFGKMLAKQLNSCEDVAEIASWAFQIYLDNSRHLETGLKEVLLDLGRMNDEPEFEYPKSELAKLAEELSAK